MIKKCVLKKIVAGLIAGAVVAFAAHAQMTDDEIIERIKPHGKVHVAGAKSEEAAAQGPRSGEQIYKQACVNCHAAKDGMQILGAPRLNNGADWQPRLDEKGLDTVWKNAVNGINAMPPMGTCGDCNEDDIKAAIEYMIKGI